MSEREKARERERQYYYRNHEKVKALKRVVSQRYYERHRETIIQKHLAYQRSHKVEYSAKKKGWRIPLDDKCELCGSTKFLVRHHTDYDKPLNVMTLCRSCHRNVHMGSLSLGGKKNKIQTD